MNIVHSDVFGLLLDEIVPLLPSFFGHVSQLLHVEIESLFQQLLQFTLVRSSALSRLVRDRLEKTEDHLIVRDRLGRVRFGRVGGRVRPQAFHFRREARLARLSELGLKRAQPPKENVVARDLGLQLCDAVVARLALFVYVTLLPPRGRPM